MADIIYVFDHAKQAAEQVLSQFFKSAKLQAVLEAFTDEVQQLENTWFDMFASRTLSTAVGAQLDQYGKLVGQDRLGFSDSDYRGLIEARIQANVSEGTPEQIIAVLFAIVQVRIHYMNTPPAAYEIEYVLMSYSSDELRTFIVDIMQDMRPAGVKLSHLAEGVPGYWGFEGDPDALALGVGEFTAYTLFWE